jgi:DNA polymerase-3 subunit epsilon
MIVTGLDLETTGLDVSAGHKIVEIALISYNAETGEKLEIYNTRVNPQRPIDPAAQAVHHITYEDVSMKPTLKEIAGEFLPILKNSHFLVAHNGLSFDFPFLTQELINIGQPSVLGNYIDTMLQGRWATPLGKRPSLEELCFACEVEYDPKLAHSALYDVECMMKCFFVGLPRGFFKLREEEKYVVS